MKKSTVHIVSVLLAGSALIGCAGTAWAHDGDRWSSRYYRFDRHGRRQHHSRPFARVIYVPVRQAPAVCVAPVNNTVVVNVYNSNGSYTPVTLRQEGGSYIGPRGERYLHMPSEEQLKRIYGL